MTVMLRFMKTMYVNGAGLAVWTTVLLLANMVVPLFFITTLEGQLVLAAAMAGAISQMAIFASKGFVRLLGIGHIFWVPLLAWLWTRLDGFPPDDPRTIWTTALLLLNGVSLIIDVRDVWQYLGGARAPHLTAG